MARRRRDSRPIQPVVCVSQRPVLEEGRASLVGRWVVVVPSRSPARSFWYKRRAHPYGQARQTKRNTSPSNKGTNTTSRAGFRGRGMQRRREDACIYAVGQKATGKPSSTYDHGSGPIPRVPGDAAARPRAAGPQAPSQWQQTRAQTNTRDTAKHITHAHSAGHNGATTAPGHSTWAPERKWDAKAQTSHAQGVSTSQAPIGSGADSTMPCGQWGHHSGQSSRPRAAAHTTKAPFPQ
jgi:hypothetical protein